MEVSLLMTRKWSAAAALLACVLSAAGARAQQPQLAATPSMGWNTWNHFHHDISDRLIRAQADAMVASGIRDAGYVYINIDSGWEGYRDAAGVLHPNKNFPDIKALGDYIHSKGLKFCLYTGPSSVTCAGAPASYGHEAQDAKMFAAWGVDYLKYDLCSYRKIMQSQSGGNLQRANDRMRSAYATMHRDLVATGQPIVFSMCQYGWNKVWEWEWGPDVGGNLWRTTGDISDNYERMTSIGFRQAGLSRYAGPGRWNDPDILEVGNGSMTADEQRTQFSLWAIAAAPLIAGNDLANMFAETKSILLNREVIAIDQDPLGKAGDRVHADGPLEDWSRPLAGGAMAAALFNRTTQPTVITFHLAALGWRGPAAARDVWKHANLGIVNASYAATVPAHSIVLLRLTRPAP
jgi:alpha-galactosidase